MTDNARFISYPFTFAILAVLVGIGGALGIALSPSPIPALVTLVGLLLLLVLLHRSEIRRIEFLILTIPLLCCTIIDIDTLPLVPIGVGSLNPADLILLTLCAIILVRALTDGNFRWVGSRLTLPFAVFFALVIVSVITALVMQSGTRHRMLSELRTLAFLLLFIVIPQFIRTSAQLRFLLRGLTVMAVVSVLIMLAQAFAGPSVEIIPAKLASVNQDVYAETGFFRVTPPAQALVRTVLILLACEWLLTPQQQRPKWLLPTLALMVLGVMITLNRNYWLGTALSLGLAVVLVDPHSRFAALKSGISLLIIGIVVCVAIFVLLQMLRIPFAQQLVETTALRLDPTSDVANTESSLETRQEELYYIFKQIDAHPLLGIGLGADYQPLRWYETPDNNRQYYTHNAYLWIAMKMGLVGLLAFVWVTTAFLNQAVRKWREPAGSRARSVVLGAGVLYAGLLISAPFSPVFLEWFWTPMIGLTIGLSETALHMEARK